MRKLLITTAAAGMLMATVPAFASSPADDAEQGRSTYPSVGECHFVLHRTMTPTGRVVLQQQQICD